MGYHYILDQKGLPECHRSIALGVIVRSMGTWLPGYNRWNPEIEVSMISNFSKVYRRSSARGWRGWIRRLGIM